jgi:hypothetical protein
MNRPSARPRDRFPSQDRRSAATCASLVLEAVSSNFPALCCREPPRGAVVDLWHADEKGEYDNIRFRYRGHIIAGPTLVQLSVASLPTIACYHTGRNSNRKGKYDRRCDHIWYERVLGE